MISGRLLFKNDFIFKKYVIFCILLLTIYHQHGISQSFKASVVAGANMAQIDGDFLYGFKKTGLTAGGRISYPVTKNMFLNLELLYSERGSSVSYFEKNDSNKYSLRYLEIPLIFSIHDWFHEEKKYYIVRAEAGFSYGALFQLKVPPVVDENQFKKNDFSYILGLGFQFTKNIGLSLRYTRSINDMLDYNLPEPDGRNLRFRGYFITGRLEYSF
ncbi:MAG: PorT family protein [Saprospiraceae bacterium]|nr:PorT family protein [Saprospiraceae bacterium]MBK6783118.1 PorT family protein [Saprospiraceae bacterium]MBK7523611.1 PorT family protein [Saprospiraceae bacterium]